MTCIECKRAIGPEETSHPVTGDQDIHESCIERYMRKAGERARLAEIFRRLIDQEVNYAEPEALADAMVEALTRSHRTLQQGFLSAVKLAVAKYASLEAGAHVDARNAEAYAWARQVRDNDRTGVRFSHI